MNKEKEDLNLTMQQKFNFDSNEFDEENTKIYGKIRKTKSSSVNINKRIKEIIDVKNKYKLKYKVFLSLFILMIFISLMITAFFYNFYNNNPKIETEVIEKTIAPENVVFLGDSITNYYELEKYYDDTTNLVNSGINSNTTTDILNDMKKRVYQYNPSKVFILIGTNDIKHNVSKEEIINNIKKIINEIKENRPYCKIYIESIYPINNTDDSKINHVKVASRTNETIKDVNAEIKKLAEELDIIYIDLYKTLADENGNLKLDYTVEGLHISEEGYKVITKELNKHLK